MLKARETRGLLFVAIAALMIVGLFTGCAKKPVPPAEETAAKAAEKAKKTTSCDKVYESALREYMASEPVKGEGLEQGKITYGEEISEGRTSAPLLPVYFDFDKYNIRPDMTARMEANARFLLDHPGVKIEIQGNCDERGTNEYNLALGERRAMSAKKYLINLGVEPARIEVVSFGEEKPLDPGHNEIAWAKNRRADFVIIK